MKQLKITNDRMDTTETSQKGTDDKELLLTSTRHGSSARDGRMP